MKIFIGADHGGFYLKEQVRDYLQKAGHEIEDEGNTELDPDDDYPQFAARVATAVLSSEDPEARGIIVCTSAQGVAMAANRYKGIRASVVWDAKGAEETRNDNDSNVLCLAGRLMNENAQLWRDVVDTWLKTPFSSAARHHRRVKELDELS